MARRDFTWRTKENRHGEEIIYCSFTVPYTQDGKVRNRRVERSTGTADRDEALTIAEKIRAEEFEKPIEEETEVELTFAAAVQNYIRQGNKSSKIKRYLLKIGNEIGDLPIRKIKQKVIDDLCERLYPDCAASTKNTQLYTPVIAVLNAFSSDSYRPPKIKRPKGFYPPSNFKEPPKNWWGAVVEHSKPNLGALVMFLRLHARRIGEACAIVPADIDADTWTVRITDTKTTKKIHLTLSQPVIDLLNKYPWRTYEHAFGLKRGAVYARLQRACAKAGVPYHVPKDIGRHSMATALLREGKSLAFVKEAGRWSSIAVVDHNYSHLEKRDVDDQARSIGEQWAEKQLRKAEVIQPTFGGKKRGTKTDKS